MKVPIFRIEDATFDVFIKSLGRESSQEYTTITFNERGQIFPDLEKSEEQLTKYFERYPASYWQFAIVKKSLPEKDHICKPVCSTCGKNMDY